MPRPAPATSIEPSRIRALASLAEQYPGTLRLFYGEDTAPTPDFIREAAREALDGPNTYYTPNSGYPELRQAIAEHYSRLHGVRLRPDPDVIVTASGMVAIQLACGATVGPGDSALVITPLWQNLQAAVRVTGAQAIEVPLHFDPTGFTLDYDLLERSVRPDTRLLALASPGNPTGWIATPEDWSRLHDFCERHDLWLLADGVYERIVFDRPGSVAPGPLETVGRDRTIVVQSFSKSYRMTGWRIGYAIAPEALASRMPHLQEFSVSHAFGVTQRAALAAIRHGEPFVEASRLRYLRHRELTLDRLSRLPGVQVPAPPGAFYVFPKMEGLTQSVPFCEWLVRELRVGVAPGAAFGAGGEGFVRLCFAVDESTLLDALDRFESGWLTYRERYL